MLKDKETIYLTNDQARHIYKKVELEGIVNLDTIKQEIEEDKLSKDNIDEDEINPHHKVIINNVDKKKHNYIINRTMVNTQKCSKLHAV